MEISEIKMQIGMIELSYYLLGSICLISALVVVSAKNPIHRIASLVIVFMMGAFIFMILDYYFLGLTYIIVYVGAIAILFLFVIMMVHLPSGSGSIEKEGTITHPSKNKMETQDEIKIISSSTKKIRILGNFKSLITSLIIAGLTLLFLVNNSNVNFKSGINSSIYTYFYPTWAIEYLTIPDIESLALLVYVAYPTALILISIALWTVMIGIISICSPRI